MNLFDLLKASAGTLIVAGAYFFGLHNGQNSEEIKHARTQITTLERTIEEHKNKQTSDAVAMAELRVAESRARDESERMRRQLADIERMSKTNADRDRNRCLRLAVEGRELLSRAERAIKFCAENHK